MPLVTPLAVDPLAVGLFVASILAAIVITRHYSQSPAKPRLATYLVLNSAPFDGIHPDVRRQMVLSFEGGPIDDLRHIELIVYNAGKTAIRNLDESLSLEIAEPATILDVSIVAKAEGVSVDAVPSARCYSFPFELLNPGEWFRIKILLDMESDPEPVGWEFILRGENLPSRVRVERPGFDPDSKNSRGCLADIFATGFLYVFTAAILPLYFIPRWLWGLDPLARGTNPLLGTLVGVAEATIAAMVARWVMYRVGRVLIWGRLPDDALNP